MTLSQTPQGKNKENKNILAENQAHYRAQRHVANRRGSQGEENARSTRFPKVAPAHVAARYGAMLCSSKKVNDRETASDNALTSRNVRRPG